MKASHGEGPEGGSPGHLVGISTPHLWPLGHQGPAIQSQEVRPMASLRILPVEAPGRAEVGLGSQEGPGQEPALLHADA